MANTHHVGDPLRPFLNLGFVDLLQPQRVVDVVEDGALAVEAMKNQSYDMIFMDMRMPNMDGLESTRKIRALPNVPKSLPIVALTANAFDDDRNACFDSGMNDLLRPSLYNAFHAIEPVVNSKENLIVADVVGPICESSDFLAVDRSICDVESGDLLAVMSAGAYGYVMSSNYCSRPRVAEVMVKDDRFHVIKARESYEDLVRGESLPPFFEA